MGKPKRLSLKTGEGAEAEQEEAERWGALGGQQRSEPQHGPGPGGSMTPSTTWLWVCTEERVCAL